MMNKNIRFMAVLVFIMIIVAPCAAFASQIDIEADPANIFVGDAVTVTVTVSGDNMAIVQGAFQYDHTILSYVSSTGGAADGKLNMAALEKGGASSLTAVIEFQALTSGAVDFSVSVESILDYNGSSLETSEASIHIDVAANPAETEGSENTEEPETSFQLDGIPASNVLGSAGEMYVWRSVQNLTLPSGFVDAQVAYNGETVGGASDGKDNPVTLVYLSDISGQDAGYYIFDADQNALQPYVVLKSAAQSLTLLWPDERVEPPVGYIETLITYNEQEVPAWTIEGSEGSVYLVYAKNDSGENAIYQYLPEDASFQRLVVQSGSGQKASGGSTLSEGAVSAAWLMAACSVCGLLLVAVIILLSLYISKKRDMQQLISISNEKLKNREHNEF